MFDFTTVAFAGILALAGGLGIAGMVVFGKSAHSSMPRGTRREPGASEKFAREVQALSEALDEMNADLDSNDPRALLARLRRLIGMAPRAAIIKGFRELEAAAVRCLAVNFYPEYAVDRLTTVELMEHLRYQQVLDARQIEMFAWLDRLWSMAFGLTNQSISPSDAEAFVRAAGLLEHDIRAFDAVLSSAHALATPA